MATPPVNFSDPILQQFADWVAERVPTKGYGDPNNVVTGSPGDEYLDMAGGAGVTYWVKESGDRTNTGWVSK